MIRLVPVVFYNKGVRRVIGSAEVDDELYNVQPNSEVNFNDAGLSVRKDSDGPKTSPLSVRVLDLRRKSV